MTHHTAARALLGLVGLLGLAVSVRAAGTLTVCTSGSPEGFDIVQYELSNTDDASGIPLYDKLLSFKPGTTDLAPGIAEKWEVSADGLVYTLQLRRGVKFHTTPWFKPTRELNADDVMFSINRMHDKAHPAHGSARGGYVYWAGMEMSSLIKEVTRVGDYTVRFTLTRPNAPFLSDLALSEIGPVYPAEYAEQLRKEGKLEQLNTLPVGSGPFVFRSYQKDAVVRYGANKDYWGGAPKVDNLVLAITVDADARVQRIKAGECLFGGTIKGQAVAGFANDPNVRIERHTPLETSYLALNVQHKALGDKRLRQALWMAIDKKSYIEAVNAGFAMPAASFLPPGIWSHDKTLKDRADPEAARQLVKASGYDGSELTMYFANGGMRLRAAELLQADWAKIGVKVKTRAMELGELYKRTAEGEHDIALLSWVSDNGDPDNFFTPNLSCSAVKGGGNKARWCEPRFDALLDAANKSVDVKKRTELYVQAQRLLYEEVSVIPLTYALTMYAVNKRVHGFVASPFGGLDFRNVSVD